MESNNLSWRSARNICIVKTLAKLGHYPTKTTEKEAWFLSPLRSETQASFSVSLIKNLWFDYGMGKGGNIIDLIMVIKIYSFREAINYLSDNGSDFFFCPPLISESTKRSGKIEIIKTGAITHPALLRYLKERCISVPVAKKYCREIWYKLDGKKYFAIGLQNNSGGWELRNKYFKSSSSPKSYTQLYNCKDRLLITEGMFDLLSLAILEPELVRYSACIILNSLAFIEPVKRLLPEYDQVYLYLDNDPAGKKPLQNF
ncbi:toprim domain-containing protein [Zunongwangia sp. F363]|uniref:Toprim domain-containing protein n=1 Tax=Autumnicola tepida TaxID=3075595 RepID=A0ABU3CE47_9FLAO|nr:toprim domain-containing protein [Zunongwangia sp. F363]MDT0644533.1 toprim domain-containing protein [Zunongwangia sp. F363]